jgi:hypothetical protein
MRTAIRRAVPAVATGVMMTMVPTTATAATPGPRGTPGGKCAGLEKTPACGDRVPLADRPVPDPAGRPGAAAGYVEAPRDPDLAYEFLKTDWRTIQHYGVEYGGRRYISSALDPYRSSRRAAVGSPTGAIA